MSAEHWDLAQNIHFLRREFPVLSRCTYLISNSLGAVPRSAKEELDRYYGLWADKGVSAWSEEWWDLSEDFGDMLGGFIGAPGGTVSMLGHATQAHWVAFSTRFIERDPERNRIVMTDHDFPSILYAASRIAAFMGWQVDIVSSEGRSGIEVESILDRVDERTLFVSTSHVYFKTAYIQDVKKIASRAREAGALSLIDGYHGPGTIPVDVQDLGVDFYVGGCLKWLCGGPGNAFLYVRKETAESLEPALTGWLGHRLPFAFSPEMEFAQGGFRFMSGTPAIPSLYSARAGLKLIREVGMSQIRNRSIHQTRLIIQRAEERGFPIHTPKEQERRGGAVSVALPHAFQVKQALEDVQVKVDFRKGKKAGSDVIRVGPHFYSLDSEIDVLFSKIDGILESGTYRNYPREIDHVT